MEFVFYKTEKYGSYFKSTDNGFKVQEVRTLAFDCSQSTKCVAFISTKLRIETMENDVFEGDF